MPNINFFFNEFFDGSEIKKINKNDLNIVVNGVILNKIKKPNIKFDSIFHEFTNEELKKYLINKRLFENHLRKKSVLKISKKLLNDKLRYPIERWFWSGNNSLYDLLYFLFSIKKKKIKKINIFYGENYETFQIYAFIFWCKSIISFFKVDIEFHYLKRGRKIKSFKSFKSFAIRYLTFNNKHSTFYIDQKFQNKNVNLIWSEGLKYKNLDNTKFVDNKNDNLYLGMLPEKYNNILSFGSRILKKELNDINIFFDRDLKKKILVLKKNKNFNHKLSIDICESFFIFYINNLLYRFKKFSKNLEKILLNFSISKFLCCCSPYLETIVLIDWCKKKKIKINLLPHSTTPSHEFHPDTYDKLFTFIKSKNIVKSFSWNKKNKHKEFLVSKNDFNINPLITNKSRNDYNKFFKLNINQKINIIISFLEKIYNKASSAIFLKFNSDLKDRNITKIGLILNCQQVYFTTDTDFTKLYISIADLLNNIKKKNFILFIKFKPGYDNQKILEKIIIKKYGKIFFKKIHFCQNDFSIEKLCNYIDVGLCYSGTSAILEVIANKLPMIEVKDRKVVYHNEPYIDVKVIPKIEIDKIVEFLFNKSYLKLIKNKQLKFLKKRQII